MAQITIDTKTIANAFVCILALIGAVAIGVWVFSPIFHPTVVTPSPYVVPVTPLPTPVPVVTQYPTTWSPVQRVDYLTTSAGFFQADTERGEIYILQNPDDYYALSTGYYVTFQRCGTDNKFNGFQWRACGVQVVRIPWDSRDDNGYYDKDGHRVRAWVSTDN